MADLQKTSARMNARQTFFLFRKVFRLHRPRLLFGLLDKVALVAVFDDGASVGIGEVEP